MKQVSLGEVIAERELIASRDQQTYTVTVRLGRPMQLEDGTFFSCPYQIVGIGDEIVRYAAGVDSMQAVELAFTMLGGELYGRHKSFSLTWFGGPDLGFPDPR